VSQYYSTAAYAIDTSLQQTADISLTTQFDIELDSDMDGMDFAGETDFSSTVTLTAIQVYDLNVNLVSTFSVAGASGTVYPVPEPASLAALGLGAVGLLRRRKKI
jgi:hypothetical protein